MSQPQAATIHDSVAEFRVHLRASEVIARQLEVERDRAKLLRLTALLDEFLVRIATRPTPVEIDKSALTAREGEVVRLLQQRLSNKEIAGLMGIATGTVKIHVKNVFEKTGITSRYQAWGGAK